VGASGNVIQDTAETGLEEEKTVMRGGNMAVKSRGEGCRGSHLGEERSGPVAGPRRGCDGLKRERQAVKKVLQAF
jgi:hypothetical protein